MITSSPLFLPRFFEWGRHDAFFTYIVQEVITRLEALGTAMKN